MKKNFINKVTALLMLAFVSTNLFSQGFYIYTKDGQRQNFANENVDSIVFYINENTIPSKKLLQIVEEDYNRFGDEKSDVDTYLFNYDSQGKLVLVTKDKDKYAISYSENSIIITTDEETATFRLSDSKIASAIEEYSDFSYTYACIYNKSGYLVRAEKSDLLSSSSNETSYKTFTWDGNKLTGYVKDGSKPESCYLEYNGKTCKGYNPVIPLLFDPMYEFDGGPIIAKPEIAGLKTDQLPDFMSLKSYESYTIDFSYEFYDDGYLKKCTLTEREGGYTIYTFTWE